MRFKAVLFDYDGVTADTPRLNYEAWRHVFAQAGATVAEREYFLLEGHGPRKVAAALCKAHNIADEHIEPLTQAKEAYMRTLGQPRIYDEIPGLLAALKKAGVAMGLVTGASRSRIEQSLSAILRPFYKAIITSDDVTHTKPHPEPYLRAAQLLNIQPADILVVENAPLGIQSAKAGGFYCVALTTTLLELDLAQADEVFDCHAALARAIHGP